VEEAVKEMRDKEAIGDYDVRGDVLEMLGEDGVRLLTYFINSIYETGEWPKDFVEVTMIALKKRLKATECSDHRTYCKDSSEGTSRRSKGKLRMYLQKISWDLEEEKELGMQLCCSE
jgi:hypothetical protein